MSTMLNDNEIAQEQFSAFTTGQAFALTLSKAQIDALFCIEKGIQLLYSGHGIRTAESLCERGLIVRTQQRDPRQRITYKLSKVGVAVIRVLEMALIRNPV